MQSKIILMLERKSNVYIVDDDPSIVKALGRLLKVLGYNARGFPSAQAFLENSDMGDEDCLILDITLPDMDGLLLQQEIKKRQCTISIIFITGNGDKQLEKKVMDAGAQGYLNKPFDEKQLINLVELALK